MTQQSENIQIRNDATSTTEANQGGKRGGGRGREGKREMEEKRERQRDRKKGERERGHSDLSHMNIHYSSRSMEDYQFL